VRRKPSDQLALKMLASHFSRTYGDKVAVDHQHSGIIAVARLCRDGKIRPVGPPKEIERETTTSSQVPTAASQLTLQKRR
jgi:hypothetical protein